VREPLSELFGCAGDEVAEVVGFEPQPEAFDRVEVRTVRRQVAALKMMPLQALCFVPARPERQHEAAREAYLSICLRRQRSGNA